MKPTQRPRRIWLKGLCAIGIICIIALGIDWYFEPYFLAKTLVKEYSKLSPLLTLAPQPLLDNAISPTPGKLVTPFGYQFELPCSDIKNKFQHAYVVGFSCTNDRWLGFFDPTTQQRFKLSEPTFVSVSTSLNTMPSQLSLWHSRAANQRTLGLLLEKSAHTVRASGHIYTITLPKLHGFQIGDPTLSSLVQFELFDDQNRRFQFMMSSKSGMTQKDINRTLQSIEPIVKSTAMPKGGVTK